MNQNNNLQYNQAIQDPSIIGTQGLKGLNRVPTEAYKQYQQAIINGDNPIAPLTLSGKSYNEYMYEMNMNTPLEQNIGFVGLNDSRFDKDITTLSQLENLEDTRAHLQSSLGKVLNGTIKGIAIAGTTALDGIVGCLMLPMAVANGISGNEKVGFWSTLWDNPISQGLQAFTKQLESWVPNYYTNEEKSQPWYNNIFTANFLGDKLIKNLGFTVGAFYSGNMISSALNALRVPGIIKMLTTSTRLAKSSAPLIGGLVSAVNEGRIEAINNSNDWAELHRMQAKDKYDYLMAHLKAAGLDDSIEAQKATELYNNELAKIEEDRVKMGNADLLSNLPILLASNMFQFGRLYSGGYKSARRVAGVIRNADNTYGVSTAAIRTKAAFKGIGNALSEGAEEMAQLIAATASGEKYSTDVFAHYKNQLDHDANEEAISYITALGKSIAETLGDINSYEEFAIGALTGALGMPRFRSIKDSKTGKRRSPIYFEGGIKEAFDLYKENTEKATELTNYMNKRLQDPKFVNYYRGLTNHVKEGKLMDEALENSDEFSYKNAEHRQLINDIMVFDNAGRLEDLQSLVNDAFDTSDESLEEIVKSSEINAFKDDKGNPMYSTPEGKEQMIEILNSKKDLINNTIKEYIKNRDRLQLEIGEYLSDEGLQELTFLKTVLNNYENRTKSIIKDGIRDNLNSLLEKYKEYYDTQFNSRREYLPDNKEYKEISDKINALERLLNKNDRGLKAALTGNRSNVRLIDSMLNTDIIEKDLKNDLSIKINDLNKLHKAERAYRKAYNEYISNPNKLENDLASVFKNAVQKEIIDKATSLIDNIQKAQSQQEVLDLLENEESDLVRDYVINELKKSDNKFVKDIDKLRIFYSTAQSIIDSKDDGSTEYKDTKSILSEFANSGMTYDDLINEKFNGTDLANAIIKDNPNMTAEELHTRVLNAKYVLDGLINKAKKDDKFKSLFSSYIKPNENKSETNTTVEEQNPEEKDLFEDKVQDKKDTDFPIEETNSKNIISDNDTIEKEEPSNTNSPLKEYYIPAIPEFHIEKSKPSTKDYRPFKDVVRSGTINFDRIYDYLESKGAFDYVNKGNLRVGQKIKFVIDPSYNETTPFMAVEKPDGSLQIIGSLMEGETAVKRYKGLQELLNKIREEYNNRNKNTIQYDDSRIIDSDNFNVDELDFDNFIYVGHQTGINNVSSILSEGLRTGSGLTGTATFLNKNTILDIINSQKEGHGHEKSNAFVIMKFPKSEFYKSKLQLDDISEILYDRHNTFNVLPQYIDRVVSTEKYTNKINSEITNKNINNSENNLFISSYSTKVASIMNGTVKFDNEDALHNLNGMAGVDTNPILAVVSSNANLTAGNRLENSLIEPLSNSTSKIGRVYLLVKNARNTYSPVAVRITPFNTANYNIDDVNTQETPVYKEIFKTVKAILSSKNDTDLSKAVSRLRNTLYLKGFHLNKIIDKTGKVKFLITKAALDAYGNEKYTFEDGKKRRIEQSEWITITENQDLDDIAKAFIKTLLRLGTNFQVNVNNANSINNLIKSNLVFSNVIDAQMRSSWFTTEYYTSEESKKGEQPKPKPIVKNTENTNSIGGKENTINGTKVTLDESDYYVNTSENKIYRSNGSEITNRNEFTQLLLDMAWANNTYGNATESDVMKGNVIVTPGGRVLDRNTNGYLDEESAEKFKAELNKSEEIPRIKLNKFSKKSPKDRLRQVNPVKYELWNKEKELKWIEKNLPQFSTEERLKLIDGLYRIAEEGIEAWGALSNGIIYLSNIANTGTGYHEAFHAVFNHLLTVDQRDALFKEAKEKWGDLGYVQLEENMADAFMYYKLSQENQNLGHRILNFFRNLYFKVTNWSKVKPTLDNYFRMIDNGSFKNKVINNKEVSRYKLPTIAELRRNAKTIREKEDVYIEEQYREAQRKVINLNNVKRFTSASDAKSAFDALHIPDQYFSHIANTRHGYKINLINREQLEKYKQDSYNAKYEQQEILNEMNQNKKEEFIEEWDRLDPDYQMELINDGWNRETWDKYSEPIKKQAIRCIGIK